MRVDGTVRTAVPKNSTLATFFSINAMVRIDRVVEPDAAHSARYGEIIDGYNRLYPAIKAWREAGATPGSAL